MNQASIARDSFATPVLYARCTRRFQALCKTAAWRARTSLTKWLIAAAEEKLRREEADEVERTTPGPRPDQQLVLP
jgi:hypothetical protein